MLRPKYVVPIFKGARAVFIASSTHGATASPWPPGHDPAPSGAVPAADPGGSTFDDGNDRRAPASAAVPHQAPPLERAQEVPPAAKDVLPGGQHAGSGLVPTPHAPDVLRDVVYPGRAGGRRSPPLGLGPPGAGLRGAGPGGSDGQRALSPPLFVPVPEQLFRQSTVLPLAAGRTLFAALPMPPEAPVQGLQTALLAAQGAGGAVTHGSSFYSASPPVCGHLPGQPPRVVPAPPAVSPTLPAAVPTRGVREAPAAGEAGRSPRFSEGLATLSPEEGVSRTPQEGQLSSRLQTAGLSASSPLTRQAAEVRPPLNPPGASALPRQPSGFGAISTPASARNLSTSAAAAVAPAAAARSDLMNVVGAVAALTDSPDFLGKGPLSAGESHISAAARPARRQQRERPPLDSRPAAAAVGRNAAAKLPLGGGVMYGPKLGEAAPGSEPLLAAAQTVEQGRRGARQQRQQPTNQRSSGPFVRRAGLLGGGGQDARDRPRDARRQGQQGPRPGGGRALVGDVCLALREMHRGALAAERWSDAEGARYRRDVVETLQRWNGSLTPYNVCDVLKQQRDPHIAMGLFEWTKSQPNYRPDVFVYTTLIGVLGAAKEMDLMGRMFNEMKAAGCKPTIVTFNRLLHAYGRNNMLPEALVICGELQAAGMVPDRVTYGTLIDTYSKAGYHEQAIKVFEEMQAAQLEPDAIAYTVLMNSYKRMGDPHKAMGLYKRMLEQGFEPNIFSYNTVIDLHGKAGRTRMAMTMFQEMLDKGVVPDVMTYSTMIDLCGKGGMYEEAEEMFAKMQEAGHVPDPVTWSTLIQMWGRAGDPQRAALYFRRMLQAGLQPSVPAYNSLMYAFLKADMFREARAAFDTLRRAGRTPSLQTYTLLLSHAISCVNQEGLDVLLGLMQAAGRPEHALLVKLLQEPGGDALEAELEAATARVLAASSTEESESRRGFTDAFIDFLRKYGREARASMVWTQARLCNIYSFALAPFPRGPEGPWTLNLHSMSAGTAAIVTLTELGQLRALALAAGEGGGGGGGGPFPSVVEIITGWGRRSRVQGQSHIKQQIGRKLEALGSPFQEDSHNIGRLFAPAAAVREWLRQPHLAEGLALHNAAPAPTTA